MANRLRILLTNDDSHDSPLFQNTIEALQEIGDVEIVVPAEEQSWKGKAMTRVGAVYADRIDLHGTPAWSVTGTPADCINLAIHNLIDERPDIVVSGTNIGKNVGVGFIFASGTVGACFEANIAGIPALALSQELAPAQFSQWMENRSFPIEIARDLRNLEHALIPLVWRELQLDASSQAITWNVNFPTVVGQEPKVVHTRIGQTFYDQCFQRKGDQFHHALHSARIDDAADTDDCVVRRGDVSVTLIDIRALGQQVADSHKT